MICSQSESVKCLEQVVEDLLCWPLDVLDRVVPVERRERRLEPRHRVREAVEDKVSQPHDRAVALADPVGIVRAGRLCDDGICQY
jgi:hypothetical protein